jgi:hypothetical protein
VRRTGSRSATAKPQPRRGNFHRKAEKFNRQGREEDEEYRKTWRPWLLGGLIKNSAVNEDFIRQSSPIERE